MSLSNWVEGDVVLVADDPGSDGDLQVVFSTRRLATLPSEPRLVRLGAMNLWRGGEGMKQG